MSAITIIEPPCASLCISQLGRFTRNRVFFVSRVFFTGIMFSLSLQLVIAQQPPPNSYRDASAGVAFKLPPGWKRDTTGIEGTMMMPEMADGTHAKPNVAFTYDSSARAKTKVHEVVFAYATWPATDIASCTHLFHAEKSSDSPDSVTIAGMEFQEFSVENDGMCQERRDTLDVAFVHGQCVAFDRQTNASCLPLDTAEGRALAAKESTAADQQLQRILQSVRMDVGSIPLATYEDGKYGIKFQYPASWKREAMGAGQLGGTILPSAEEKPPFHGVSLVSPVGYFRYRVIAGVDAANCSRTVQWAIDQDDTPPHSVSIGGVPFHTVFFSAPVMGQSFEGTVFWSLWRGNCYLFETDMYTHPVPPDANHALMASRRRVKAEYKNVIQSVRIVR